MVEMINKLKGLKGYLVGVIALALGAYRDDANMIMWGLGILALRAGMENSNDKLLDRLKFRERLDNISSP